MQLLRLHQGYLCQKNLVFVALYILLRFVGASFKASNCNRESCTSFQKGIKYYYLHIKHEEQVLICKLASIDEIKEKQWYEFNLQTDDGLFSLMLQKIGGSYVAYKNFCPHQGRRMNYSAGMFLTSKEGNIVCPAHGAEFNPNNGLCVNGPCLGESLQPVHIQLNEESVFAIIK